MGAVQKWQEKNIAATFENETHQSTHQLKANLCFDKSESNLNTHDFRLVSCQIRIASVRMERILKNEANNLFTIISGVGGI